MDIAQFKERQAEAWGLGDYSSLSRVLEPAARELCDACAVSAGQEVLDVAAGDGNFALACASEGASVVASDLAPAMVEAGRARTDAEGYDVEWVLADAEELPFGTTASSAWARCSAPSSRRSRRSWRASSSGSSARAGPSG